MPCSLVGNRSRHNVLSYIRRCLEVQLWEVALRVLAIPGLRMTSYLVAVQAMGWCPEPISVRLSGVYPEDRRPGRWLPQYRIRRSKYCGHRRAPTRGLYETSMPPNPPTPTCSSRLRITRFPPAGGRAPAACGSRGRGGAYPPRLPTAGRE